MKEEIIKGFNKDDGYSKHNGFKITKLDKKDCVMEYIVRKDGLNPIKIVHGGLLFGLADTTAGTLACMSGKFPVTINSTINYLNQANCEKLIATASILKQGNSVGFYKVDVHNEKKELLCTCNINMYLKKIEQ